MKSNQFFRFPKAFTLIEILIAIVIVATLSAISTPVVRSVIRKGRSAACLSNLRQIGIGLNSYTQDHGARLPEMEASRSHKGSENPDAEEIPVLETVLAEYLENPEVFHCPEDKVEFKKSGSSYLWNSVMNGLKFEQLNFFGITDDGRIPLVSDKEAWHNDSDSRGGTQFLYANGAASGKLKLEVGND